MSVDPPPPTRPLYCFRRPGPVRDSVDQAGSRVPGIFWLLAFFWPLSGLGQHSVFGVWGLFHGVLFGNGLQEALRESFSGLLWGHRSSFWGSWLKKLPRESSRDMRISDMHVLGAPCTPIEQCLVVQQAQQAPFFEPLTLHLAPRDPCPVSNGTWV